MQITIDDMLRKRNKSRYWLAKNTECNYQNLCKICNNKTDSMSFSLTQKICDALNCEPNDIFDINIDKSNNK